MKYGKTKTRYNTQATVLNTAAEPQSAREQEKWPKSRQAQGHHSREIGRKLAVSGVALALSVAAVAQSIPSASNAAAQEKQWQNCEGGYYTGPRQGRRNYSNDKYLWTVTPEFAKRFCMPEHMVSPELKGAEAIAFRMVDGADLDRCAVDDEGKATCSENSKGRFEIYLPQTLNLPAANPNVKYFNGEYKDSEMHISSRPGQTGVEEKASRGMRYRKGEYKLPDGRTNHFANPYAHPDPGHRFALIYAHEGKGRWPVGPLWEVGFRGNWIQGMDMLILEEQLGMGYSRYLNVEKANSHGYAEWQPIIVMDQRNDNRKDGEKRIPDDYAHIIYLPKSFANQVRQASLHRNGSWLDFIKTMQQR